MSDQNLPVRAGVFEDRTQADNAIMKLHENDFTNEQISVICSEESVRQHFGAELASEPAGAHVDDAMVVGSVGGLALGGFAAIAGVVATGGITLVAAGSVLALGLAGTFAGAMVSRGFEKEDADYYDQAVAAGKILISVEDHSENQADRLLVAEKILREAGAEPLELPEG